MKLFERGVVIALSVFNSSFLPKGKPCQNNKVEGKEKER